MEGGRALVVAEDPEVAPAVERLLGRRGLRVTQVRQGAQGAGLLRVASAEPFRVVVVVCPRERCRSLAAFAPLRAPRLRSLPGVVVGGPEGLLERLRLENFEREPLPLVPRSFLARVQRLLVPGEAPSRSPTGGPWPRDRA